MYKKEVIFIGSKPIGYICLAYLISKKEELNINIVGILSNFRKEFGNEHNLHSLAAQHKIPVFSNLDNIPNCDIIYSVQYNEILKQEHINKARIIAINLHMAPLPEFRGTNQFSFAIIDEKKEFGTTIHQINTGIDSGDILFQKRFLIPDKCNVSNLYELTYEASIKLFKQTIKHIITGNYKPIPQAMLIPKYGTSLHYRKEMDKIKIIDLDWEKEKIERYLRATSMPGFEPPYCLIDGKKVHFVVS